MDIFNKLLDLYSEIGDIYLNLCNEEIQGLIFGKAYKYLVSLLKEKTKEEKKLFKELYDSECFEQIKSLIFEEDNIITMRLKDYIKAHDELNVDIDGIEDEEELLDKQLSMKMSKLISTCTKNIFLVYSSFLDEYVRENNNSEIKDRIIAIKYYNSFTKHYMEEVLLDYNFNIPLENYVDVYFVAETLGIDVAECDQIILDSYIVVIEEIIEQLMSFVDSDYDDYNKLAAIMNAIFMLQACFALLSEKDYLFNEEKILEKIDELRNEKNDRSAKGILEIINMREKCQSRVMKLSFRPFVC